MNADIIRNFDRNGTIALTDVLPAAVAGFVQDADANSGQGVLSYASGSLALVGIYDPAKFVVTSDGGAGSTVRYAG